MIVPSQPVTALQATPTRVSILAKDLSLRRSIGIKIVSSPYYGSLRSLNGNLTSGSIVAGSVSSSQYQNGIGLNVTYTGAMYYFNTPSVTWRGVSLNLPSENFTVVAQSSDGSQSLSTIYPIQVQNVNDPTDFYFNVPTAGFEVYAYSAVSSNSNSSISSTLKVNGFQMLDYDLGVDPVRVEISASTSSARITLNRQYIPLLDFSSLQYCFALVRWQCSGNGYSSNSMSFVAQPLDALSALNGLTYINTQPNIQDTVTVTIYDGEGGFCLDNSQQGSGSVRSGCYVSSASFSVSVRGFSNVITNTASTSSVLSLGYVLYAMIGLGVILCILLSRCAYYGCRCRKPKSKKSRQASMLPSFWRAKIGGMQHELPPGYTVLQFGADSSEGTNKAVVKGGTRVFRLDDDGLPRPFPIILLPQDINTISGKHSSRITSPPEESGKTENRRVLPISNDSNSSDGVLDFIMGKGKDKSTLESDFLDAKRVHEEKKQKQNISDDSAKLGKPRVAVRKAGDSFKPDSMLPRKPDRVMKFELKNMQLLDSKVEVLQEEVGDKEKSNPSLEVVKSSSPPGASPTVQNSCTADAYKANLAKFEAIRSELSTKRTARTNRPDKRHLLRPISTLPLSKSEILSPGLPTEGNPKIEIHSDTASPSKAEVTELPKLQGPRKVLRAANKNFKI